jgi:hypothetical protein
VVEGIDAAWDRPTVGQLVAAGKHFMVGYVSRDPSKNITKAECDAALAAGIDVCLVWETTVADFGQWSASTEGDDMPLTPADLDAITHRLLFGRDLPSTNPTESVGTALLASQNNTAALVASQSSQDKTLAALLAAVTKLATSGTSTDTAAVLAAIKAVGDAESTAVAGLHAQIADLKTRLVAAEQAAAGALAGS